MALFSRSILTPQNSVISGVAVAGSVYAIYAMAAGTLASAHASDANHMSLEASRKKAGYTAFVFVSAVTLMTRDANVGILGFGSIATMEILYRHSIMVEPNTGVMQAPDESVYSDAANVVPIDQQGYSVG